MGLKGRSEGKREKGFTKVHNLLHKSVVTWSVWGINGEGSLSEMRPKRKKCVVTTFLRHAEPLCAPDIRFCHDTIRLLRQHLNWFFLKVINDELTILQYFSHLSIANDESSHSSKPSNNYWMSMKKCLEKIKCTVWSFNLQTNTSLVGLWRIRL